MFRADDQPDNLDAYMNLGSKEIVRLVLLLLVEEGLRKELAAFRAEQLLLQPVQGREKLGIVGNDAKAVCDRAG